MQYNNMASISAYPLHTLVDENVLIKVSGLQPSQKITLYSSCKNDTGDLFESFAFYFADKNGNVNLAEDRAMFGGSYEGVEPMGLFWSMTESKLNSKQHVRMVKKDIESPLDVTLEIYDGFENLNELRNKIPLENKHVYRWYKSKNVTRVPVRSGAIRGTLLVPPGNDHCKTIVDMFGGAGGLFEFRASMLASRGFLVLSLALFNYEDLSTEVFDDGVRMEYFEEAVQFLQNHKRCAKGGVGVIGTSFGSDIALSMATLVPGVTCCICINGSNMVYSTPIKYRGFTMNPHQYIWSNMSMMNESTLNNKNMIIFPNKDEYLTHKSVIQFYKSTASFLFIGSEEDCCFPMPSVHNLSKYLLRKNHGGKGSYEFVLYPGAGHLLELPNTPLCPYVYYAQMRYFVYYGGEVKQHARAQVQSWSKILDFFNKNIIKMSQSKL